MNGAIAVYVYIRMYVYYVHAYILWQYVHLLTYILPQVLQL